MSNTGERKGTVEYQTEESARATAAVVVESAPGAALGADGFFHPVEIDPEGRTRTTDSPLLSAILDLTAEIRALRQGFVLTGAIPDLR